MAKILSIAVGVKQNRYNTNDKNDNNECEPVWQVWETNLWPQHNI
jgi:hypothetical protein